MAISIILYVSSLIIRAKRKAVYLLKLKGEQLSVSATGEHLLLLFSREQGAHMYTHLYISRSDAHLLFLGYAPKPLVDGEIGVITDASFDAHFHTTKQVYLKALGAQLEIIHSQEDTFVLKLSASTALQQKHVLDITKVKLGAL